MLTDPPDWRLRKAKSSASKNAAPAACVGTFSAPVTRTANGTAHRARHFCQDRSGSPSECAVRCRRRRPATHAGRDERKCAGLSRTLGGSPVAPPWCDGLRPMLPLELHALSSRSWWSACAASSSRCPGCELTMPQAARLWGLDIAVVRGGRRGAGRCRVPAVDRVRDRRAGRRVAEPAGRCAAADATVASGCTRRHLSSETSRIRATMRAMTALTPVDVLSGARCSPATMLDAAYDEMFDAAGAPRPHCRAALRRAAGGPRGRARAAPGRGRQGVSHPGHHLHRLRRRAGHRADLPLRPAAAHHHRRRVATRSSAA